MSAQAAVASAPLTDTAGGHYRRPGVATVLGWELRKLAAQRRSYVGLALAILPPLAFVIFWNFHQPQHRGGESVFAREITSTGLAIPILMLIFESALLIPIVSSLVAGDIFAAEDGNGTLKTILTRSVDRGQIFLAKVLAAFSYALLALLLATIVATIAGIASWGFNPVETLSGTKVAASEALGLLFLADACFLIPLFALVSFGLLLSATTRNSAASVLATVALPIILYIVAQIPGLEGIRPYLLTEQFQAWQGLLHTPTDWAPIAHSAWLCALYALPCLAAAYLTFLRRDVAGG